MKKMILAMAAVLFSVVAFSQEVPTSDSSLKQYTGTYKFPEGSVVAEIAVLIDGGSLVMSASAGTSPLEKREEDLFFIVQFQGTAKFNRDANRKVVGVTINAMGYVLEGTRTEGALTWLVRRNANERLPEKICR
ncbi:MAG: DUF3471 domain-containing protein [Bacteroidota bacterium]|jgi:hypothetical protein